MNIKLIKLSLGLLLMLPMMGQKAKSEELPELERRKSSSATSPNLVRESEQDLLIVGQSSSLEELLLLNEVNGPVSLPPLVLKRPSEAIKEMITKDANNYTLKLSKKVMSSGGDTIRSTVSLKQFDDIVDVWNQESIGSCTANALLAGLTYYGKQRADITNLSLPFSRLYQYHVSLVREAEINKEDPSQLVDAGSSLDNALLTVREHGLCFENYWPYKGLNFKKSPLPSAYRSAMNPNINQKMDQEYDKKSMNGNFILSQMLKFADLEMVAQKTKKNISHLIYNEILQNRPVFLGILVYGDMGNAPGGFVTLPKEGTYSDGGHAILATGYLVKDGKEYVKFRNSWGKNWGEKGNGYLPSEYLKDNLIGAYSLWLDDLLVKSERLLAANPLVQEKREQSA